MFFKNLKIVTVIKKLEVSICYKKLLQRFNKFLNFCLEPILASEEINRAQSLDELHMRLAAIRGKILSYAM